MYDVVRKEENVFFLFESCEYKIIEYYYKVINNGL